jgi:hypothetical protein
MWQFHFVPIVRKLYNDEAMLAASHEYFDSFLNGRLRFPNIVQNCSNVRRPIS